MRFGFIGCGNMGGAIARAVCRSVSGRNVYLADADTQRASQLAEELNCQTATNEEAALCDYVFLALKPQVLPLALPELAPIFAARTDDFVLVTMAAGLSIQRILELAGGNYPIIRIMPNTPAMLGEGMIEYCTKDVPEEKLEAFLAAMKPAGLLDSLPENMIDAASAVAGCGPAWVYQMIEALADGGVACGLPRQKAMRYAAQTLLGGAKMVLESGKHPGELKDAVCSPGGSTIQGVRVLEERAFRGAVTDAVIAAYDKTKELGAK